MSYQALYRAYRPQTFADLIGQDAISRTLQNALVSNRLSHAYLFCGPRGTGKTSTSKILAKAVNCLHPEDGEPCNDCENCRAINEDTFLDVIEIDAASNRGIDEIRNIREQTRFAPAMGKRKVYIIDEVHMLTTEAFNALLKTLEEPPEYVLFILATTDPQKIPKTVLSRTQRFDFRRISTGALAGRLREIADREGIDISDATLALIAKNAAGGMRDAISLLDQTIAFAGNEISNDDVTAIIGGLDENTLVSLTDAVIAGDASAVFDQLSQLNNRGCDDRALIHSLVSYFRDMLLARVGHPAPDGEQWSPELMRQCKVLSLGRIEQLMKMAADAERDMRINTDTELVIELTMVEMMLLLHEEAAPAANPSATSLTPKQAEAKATIPKTSESASTPISNVSEPVAITSENSSSADEAPDAMPFIHLCKIWPDIVEGFRENGGLMYGCISAAKPYAFNGNVLTLRFDSEHSVMMRQIRQKKHNDALLEALAPHFPDKRINIIYESTPVESAPIEEALPDLTEIARSAFGDDIPIINTDIDPSTF